MTSLLARPRLLGLVCGAGATASGLAYMAAAAAPTGYLLINLATLLIGAAAWLALGRFARAPLAGAGGAVLALSVPLLLTTLFGAAVEDASRWVRFGPLTLQTSLIVMPAMIVLYARRPDAVGTAGMAVAALALAAQPDRAMAGVLLASLAAVAVTAPDRLSLAALTAAAAAFAWTLLTPDTLPAVPFVDGILYTAFDVHLLVGLAVAGGAVLLLAPAVLGTMNAPQLRPVLLAFGGCWAAVVLAAALGNYSTPLVGYGGSAVLGYLLSVALLPNAAHRSGDLAATRSRASSRPNDDRQASQRRAAPAA